MAQYFELHSQNPQLRLIRRAAEIVRNGGVIAYPTDSCYALGCHIGDAAALERLRRIRGAVRVRADCQRLAQRFCFAAGRGPGAGHWNMRRGPPVRRDEQPAAPT